MLDVRCWMFDVRHTNNARDARDLKDHRMNWTNVRLILQREIRDQLRDRRTLFMIFVLPVILYPLLGVTFMQLGQLAREEPTKVLVVGAENLPAEPALIVAADGRPQLAALDGELKPDS